MLSARSIISATTDTFTANRKHCRHTLSAYSPPPSSAPLPPLSPTAPYGVRAIAAAMRGRHTLAPAPPTRQAPHPLALRLRVDRRRSLSVASSALYARAAVWRLVPRRVHPLLPLALSPPTLIQPILNLARDAAFKPTGLASLHSRAARATPVHAALNSGRAAERLSG